MAGVETLIARVTTAEVILIHGHPNFFVFLLFLFNQSYGAPRASPWSPKARPSFASNNGGHSMRSMWLRWIIRLAAKSAEAR